MATTPFTHPALYNSINLGGQDSPGKVTLSGHDRKHGWDQQQPKGTSGEFTVNKGPKNGGFTATFQLVTLEQAEAWDSFQRLIASTVEGPKPKALPVYHPDLVRNKITDVVCESIGGMQNDDRGGQTVVVKFLEYRPPKAKPATRAGADAKSKSRATQPDPNADAKRELAALIAQAKEP